MAVVQINQLENLRNQFNSLVMYVSTACTVPLFSFPPLAKHKKLPEWLGTVGNQAQSLHTEQTNSLQQSLSALPDLAAWEISRIEVLIAKDDQHRCGQRCVVPHVDEVKVKLLEAAFSK